MKNIFLSVVIICALVIAGVGGTLAGFSDTEQSIGNRFEVGNMDLKVSKNGIEYNDPVPAIAEAFLAWPCVSQDFSFDLHNLSDNPQSGYAYIKFKNLECKEVFTTKFPSPARPEPKTVAESGGLLNQETIGIDDEVYCVADFVEIYVQFDTNGDGRLEDIIGNPIWGGAGTVYLGDLEELWIPVGQIPGCNTRDGKISMHISNWSEEEWNAKFKTEYAFFANDLPFNDWLTNLFQNEGAYFDIEFALTQDPIPAIYQVPD
ncbi:MAG: hypothetical protein PHU08_02205 [Dehalococcoidales bacterium]|nr:hypothetical protein [Dehalococcoidales bacterium]